MRLASVTFGLSVLFLASVALAQGEQVRATTPQTFADGGTEAPGAKSWAETRPHSDEAKYADTRALLDKKVEEKPKAAVLKWGNGNELEFYQAVQVWTTYTLNAQASPDGVQPLTYVDDRGDLFIRRGRVGFKGKIFEKSSFNIAVAYDGLGKDQHNAVRGGNNPTGQIFFVLDAMWTYQAHPAWANITVGYFRPQIGRESITGAFNVDSFEKAMTQNYMRTHIVGRTQGGRESGINVGGLINGAGWGINYNAGIFDTTNSALVGAFDDHWAPMLAARVAFTVGDPEMEKYGLSYAVNYFGKRTGVTFAVQGTTQGRTDTFERNSLLGFDLLANWKGLSLTSEFHILGRNRFGVHTQNHIGHVRAGYAFAVGDYWFEPVATYSEARGSSLYTFTGRDRLFEAAFNWYLSKNNFKLNVAYSKNLVSVEDGGTSDFTDQRRFARGDFVGVGLQYVY